MYMTVCLMRTTVDQHRVQPRSQVLALTLTTGQHATSFDHIWSNCKVYRDYATQSMQCPLVSVHGTGGGSVGSAPVAGDQVPVCPTCPAHSTAMTRMTFGESVCKISLFTWYSGMAEYTTGKHGAKIFYGKTFNAQVFKNQETKLDILAKSQNSRYSRDKKWRASQC